MHIHPIGTPNMATSSQHIISLYKSRQTIIHLLKRLDYNVEDYENFSINEVDAMNRNEQMDMLIYHKEQPNPKKVYIKYISNLRQQALEAIIDDLFRNNQDNEQPILNKTRDFLVIIADEPNDCIKAKLEYLYEHEKIFVVVHNMKRLQFNILEHDLVPKVRILDEEESRDFIHKYNLTSLKQLPEISRFDPMALAICMKPNQICEIIRNSVTALNTKYYRVCV
jgi:DNA-directed RNA polymerase subunit H (RpoH/RPB5)